MKNILLFSGSNSSVSINKKLIDYTATLFSGVDLNVIDLRNYESPVYQHDIEENSGLPSQTMELLDLFDKADGIVLSTPEHNAMPPAFLKNILDWMTRINRHLDREEKYLENKPVLLMSTSGGRGGAMKARALIKGLLERGNANVVAEFSLPSFNHNSDNGVIHNEDLNKELKEQISAFLKVVVKPPVV